MNDDRNETTRYERLNWLGKTVFWGGLAIRSTARLVDTAVERAGSIASEAEKAFKDELRDDVEDARVVDEWDDENR